MHQGKKLRGASQLAFFQEGQQTVGHVLAIFALPPHQTCAHEPGRSGAHGENDNQDGESPKRRSVPSGCVGRALVLSGIEPGTEQTVAKQTG